ncbi:hypothetical protein EW093_09165 [Thiospirochaeta perfilievii]|uniref:Uncharacterized protein n=1 Tax=Thiospirochaeta perfilievii TaxID=252967 RepID=A0A5C1QDZ1_9SPIO|nr:hypothetical protein [Thiospirochaeta perfilievii]QEN04866.1 hypothetical protein EW093_09165 [Thiospirochaeta perfilievii]
MTFKLKGLIIPIFVMTSLSCNSIHSSFMLKNTTYIKISKYENYYERTPYTEIYIRDRESIDRVLSYLKFIDANSIEIKDSHDFLSTRTSIDFIFKDRVKQISIIGDKIEIGDYKYARGLSYFKKRFVKLINSF